MQKRQHKKIFWGILFLFGAVALLVGGLGYLDGFNFWSILFSVILLGCLVNGILDRSFGEILFSLALLIIINDEFLQLEAITPWPVLGAALLGTIGLNSIFPKRFKDRSNPLPPYPENTGRPGKNAQEFVTGEEIHCAVSFGYAVKYIVGQNISRIFLDSSFGNLEVYFNDAVFRDNRANAFIECSFGNMEIYVPAGWNVVTNIKRSFGSVEESGYGNPNGTATLFLEGNVVFGYVEIHHI